MGYRIGLETVLELLDSAAVVIDQDQILQDFNQRFIDLTGLHQDKIKGLQLASFFEPGGAVIETAVSKEGNELREKLLRVDQSSIVVDIKVQPLISEFGGRAFLVCFYPIDHAKVVKGSTFSSSLFSAITEGISDAFVSVDKNWVYTYVNKRAGELFHRDPSGLIGKHIWSEFPEGIGQPFYNAYMKAMHENEFVKIEEYYPPWDKWFENRIYPFEGGLLIFFQDITQRKLVEQELMRINNVLSEAIKLGRMGTWEWNLRSDTLWWSDSLYELTGQNKLSFSPSFDLFELLVHTDDASAFRKSVSDSFNSLEPVYLDFRILYKGSGVVFFRSVSRVYLDPLGRKEKVIGVMMDITELERSKRELLMLSRNLEKKVEEKTVHLAESQSNLMALIENTRDGIWSMDSSKRLIVFNQAFNRSYKILTGKDLVLGEKLEEILDPIKFKSYYEFWNNLVNSVLKGNQFMEEYYIDFGDRTVIYLISCSPIEIDGHVEGATFFSKDITKLKQSEKIIIELNKELVSKVEELQQMNEELNAFTYSVSHDLRAPIRVISGFAELTERRLNNNEFQNGLELLHGIRENAKKMNQLIDDLLEFSKVGKRELNRTMVNMNELVDAVIREIQSRDRENENVKFIIHDLPHCNADYGLLTQVVINLVSNAVKYSSKNPNPVVEIGSTLINGKSTYYVKDNGVGFNMEYSDKLFQVFQRLHSSSDFPGTGVGLAIVNRIIKKHHGKVWADAEEGKGATFYFTIG